MSLADIREIMLVLSGKGGVGKSSVTTQLALALSLQGHSVGVLDIDLTGPSIPRFFGIESEKSSKRQSKLGALHCMSLGFLLGNRGDAVVWRGPKKTAMVRQFLSDVHWGSLDYLLIDTPPGTSDEHISLVETLLKTAAPGQVSGAVIVTTPQAISISDVKKEINFCRKTGLRRVHKRLLQGWWGGHGEEFDVPFLGSVPIDPMFVGLIEEGKRPVYPQGTVIAGKDMSADDGAEDSNGAKDEGSLAEKYTSCSLYPLFDGFVTQLTAKP
ncbi:cytosolic Fe-S cluster assembly factor cfd1 [Taxawa tesnikishii (nom. ined.)]|nr:cytosolic Fe-S cluster assembly factor cfd1 [Dothideales sp. JES 119]